MVPRAAGQRLGAALTQLNRRNEWVVKKKKKREGWGAPSLTLKSGFSLKISVASLGFKSLLSRFLFLVEEYMGKGLTVEC